MALVTQKEYARRRRVSPQYISKLVREGVIKLVAGKVDPDKADRSRAAHSAEHKPRRRAPRNAPRETGNGKRATGSSPGRPPRGSSTRSQAEERANKLHYEAKIAQLDYEQRSESLLPRDQVLEAERRVYAKLRTNLRAIARQLAPDLARTVQAAECEALVLGAIDHALTDCAADPLGLGLAEAAVVCSSLSVADAPGVAVPPELRTSAVTQPEVTV